MEVRNYQNSIAFSRRCDIGAVRQAANNLRGVRDKVPVCRRCAKSMLKLDRLMAKKGHKGFDDYIASLSLKQVQDLLTSSVARLKRFMRIPESPGLNCTQQDLDAWKKLKSYETHPLIAIPQK